MHILILILVGLASFGLGATFGKSLEQEAVADMIAFRERVGHDVGTILEAVKVRVKAAL